MTTLEKLCYIEFLENKIKELEQNQKTPKEELLIKLGKLVVKNGYWKDKNNPMKMYRVSQMHKLIDKIKELKNAGD